MELENNSLNLPNETNASDDGLSGFQWNLLGWFGASLGSSLWMLVTPFFLSWPPSGVVAGIIGTLAIWSFSSLAWGMRARLTAFAGLVGLLFATVTANMGFLLFAHLNKLPLDTAAETVESNYGLYYGILLLLVVSLMILFWLKENRARK